MLIKGIILSLDLNNNNCVVELPTFENVSGDKATATAVFAIPPGNSNGYKVGDIIIVGFELERLNKPIVIGKLYTGTETETSDTSAVKCNTLRVSNSATLPGSTSLTYDTSLTNSFKKYGTIADIVSALNTTTNKVNNLTINSKTQKWLDIKFNRWTYSIEVYLNGFGSEDVGSKVYLYKSTKGKPFSRQGYSHPANLAKNDGEIAGMGYGVFAGKRRDENTVFPELPTWMHNNGLIQTEWTITQSQIDVGFIQIPILWDWNALVCSSSDDESLWCNIIGSGRCGTYGATTSNQSTKYGALKIKFAYWDKYTNTISPLTSTTFRFGVRLRYAYPENLVTSSGQLIPWKLYTSVK